LAHDYNFRFYKQSGAFFLYRYNEEDCCPFSERSLDSVDSVVGVMFAKGARWMLLIGGNVEVSIARWKIICNPEGFVRRSGHGGIIIPLPVWNKWGPSQEN
jgi:hypothetical protein